MPLRVCSARARAPFIYLPYGELTPAHGYDDGYLYVRGLFVQCSMREAEEEMQDVMLVPGGAARRPFPHLL